MTSLCLVCLLVNSWEKRPLLQNPHRAASFPVVQIEWGQVMQNVGEAWRASG